MNQPLTEFMDELKKLVQSSTDDHSWESERRILLEELHYLAELGRLGVDLENVTTNRRPTVAALKKMVEKTVLHT